MLQTIHDKLKGWFAYVVLGAVGSTFVLWGINWTLGAPTYAAKVNGHEIPLNEVREAYQRQLAQAQRGGQIQLSDAQRAAMLKIAEATGAELVQRTRLESDQAVAKMQSQGLTVYTLSPEQRAGWQAEADTFQTRARARIVPAELHDQILHLVAEYRAGKHA